MKKFLYLILLTIPLFALWFFISSSTKKDKAEVDKLYINTIKADKKNVAVLELFTSQGCSSCPSADRLLGAYTSKDNVIVLSFHVDYWNHLGWKDPFSSKEYTKRQYAYASVLHSDVYTPQLVVNGQYEMVGSDANKIQSTIQKVVTEEPDATLEIKDVKQENGKATINFTAIGNTGNSLLHIALVEKKTTTDIEAGENGGVTLDSYNVVTNFKTINNITVGDNSSSIDISSSDLKNMSVVIFLQNKNNNKISAAAQSSL